MLRFTCRVNTATAAMARPARHPAALQRVGIESPFRLVVPCWTPRGMHPDDRPTAPSRLRACEDIRRPTADARGRVQRRCRNPKSVSRRPATLPNFRLSAPCRTHPGTSSLRPADFSQPLRAPATAAVGGCSATGLPPHKAKAPGLRPGPCWLGKPVIRPR
jgi:hypothetical protein